MVGRFLSRQRNFILGMTLWASFLLVVSPSLNGQQVTPGRTIAVANLLGCSTANSVLQGGATPTCTTTPTIDTANLSGGILYLGSNSNRIRDNGSGIFGFTNSTDVGVRLKMTAAQLQVLTTASADTATIAAKTHLASAGTFANCNAAPVEGMLCAITDSSTATWGATITGSGSNHVLGYYNGTNWTVAAK